MNCKNCGHELAMADYYPSIVIHEEHVVKKRLFGLLKYTKIKCHCGCKEPELSSQRNKSDDKGDENV